MKLLLSPLWALLSLLLVTAIFYKSPYFVESVKLRYFDTLIVSKQPTINNIFTVNIDEPSLEKFGQWPFPRDRYADIIKDLYSREAGLVVFTAIMPEADRFGKDQILAETLEEYPVVLANVPHSYSQNQAKNPGAAIINSDFLDRLITYPGIIANVPAVEEFAIGIGTVNTLPEIDGITRRVPLVSAVDGILYPSIGLEVLRVIAGDSSFQIKLNSAGVDKMRIPQFGIVPTDSLGRTWIDWSQQNFSVSLSDLPDSFDGAVVIVGPTAAGISNPVATAAGAVFPHDLHASTLGTLFNGVNIQRPYWADAAELLLILIAGAAVVAFSFRPWVGIAFTVVAILATFPASWFVYQKYAFLLDAVLPTAAILITAVHAYGIKFLQEFLQKQAIKKQFAGYASPGVVKLLQEKPDIIKQGTKREVSIVFSDLRGFTPLGESFGDDVAGLTKIMNGYMDAITQPVLDNNGMIIKYIGDASMHVHNAPFDDHDHAVTAVKTGLQMLKAVERFNAEVVIPQGRPPVGMGAGINTGLGYLGEMGSTQRHSYDVLGDAVSTAARIESKCKEYGCLLLIGAETVERCGEEFFFLKIDNLTVKGKSVGVVIYTVLNDVLAGYNKSKELHDQMHELYRNQQFVAAAKLCQQLKGEFDSQLDKYYDMWHDRCIFMQTQNLPNDWDGSFIAQSK